MRGRSARSRDQAPATATSPEPVSVRSAMPDGPTAFPTLDAPQIAALGSIGTRRAVAAGEVLYREGDAAYDFSSSSQAKSRS